MQFKVTQNFTRGLGCFLFFILSQEALISPMLIWCNNGTGNFLQETTTEPQCSVCYLGRIRSFLSLLGKHMFRERKGLGD